MMEVQIRLKCSVCGQYANVQMSGDEEILRDKTNVEVVCPNCKTFGMSLDVIKGIRKPDDTETAMFKGVRKLRNSTEVADYLLKNDVKSMAEFGRSFERIIGSYVFEEGWDAEFDLLGGQELGELLTIEKGVGNLEECYVITSGSRTYVQVD